MENNGEYWWRATAACWRAYMPSGENWGGPTHLKASEKSIECQTPSIPV